MNKKEKENIKLWNEAYFKGYDYAISEVKETLEFYSRTVKYQSIRQDDIGSIYDDNGKKARECLIKIGCSSSICERDKD